MIKATDYSFKAAIRNRILRLRDGLRLGDASGLRLGDAFGLVDRLGDAEAFGP